MKMNTMKTFVDLLKSRKTSFGKSFALMMLWMTTMVFNAVNPAWAGPEIQHWTADNGLKVYYVHSPQLPMVDFRLVFDAGSARDGKALGRAGLAGSLLNKGAGDMDANAIALAFESVGAQFSAGADEDRSYISLRTVTMKDEFTSAIDTWLTVLDKPTFPEEDFKRLISQVKTRLKAQKQSPASIASKAFYKHLYGDHPYGQPASGTDETIEAMQLDDVKEYFKRYYVANNGLLAIVGDIDRKKAETIANQVAKALGKGKPAESIPAVKLETKAANIHIPFPSSQTHIYVGQIGDKRGDKDYFTLYLGNHILGGGGFTSRLTKEIRVKRGLSYSVYSYFLPLRQYGPFMIGLQTKNDQKDKAIEVVKTQLVDFIEKGPSEKEVVQSQKNITGGFPLRTASNSDIVSYISMIGFYGLPLDYLESFPKTIGAIDKESIQQAFKRRVKPDDMVVISVGQAPKVETDTDVEKEADKSTREDNEKK